MIQLVSSDPFSGPLAKIDRGTPLLLLLRGQFTGMERRGLIADFSCRDVREERADGVAVRIVQVVELVDSQACDGLEVVDRV